MPRCDVCGNEYGDAGDQHRTLGHLDRSTARFRDGAHLLALRMPLIGHAWELGGGDFCSQLRPYDGYARRRQCRTGVRFEPPALRPWLASLWALDFSLVAASCAGGRGVPLASLAFYTLGGGNPQRVDRRRAGLHRLLVRSPTLGVATSPGPHVTMFVCWASSVQLLARWNRYQAPRPSAYRRWA